MKLLKKRKLELEKLFDDSFLEKILKGIKVLDNPNRLEILRTLDRVGDMNIKTLSEKVNISYKNTLAHLKKLEEIEVIKLDKQEKSQGREVIVSLNKNDEEESFIFLNSFVTWAEKQKD